MPISAGTDRRPNESGALRSLCSRLGGALIAVSVIAGTATAARAESIEATFARYAKGSAAAVDHGVWARLLTEHVKPGADGLNRVDYKAFKAKGHTDLKAYIGSLVVVDVAKLDRPEQFAFWSNLYNAKTIDIVLDKYPVTSIKDISLGGGILASITGGPWKAKVVKVMGHDLSLDDIEHVILRAIFKDPRVHYAVNCASVGCPNLMTTAFTGAMLEAQLEAGAKAYVNHPRGIRVEGGRVYASNIYDWFKADFGGSADGVLKHVRVYADPALKQKLEGLTRIYDYGYDWSLNDVAR
ncbi:MAG TPA: DUF547 domain-containing protein [Hyphomicrobiaceae bacterium]|nr:DUF547 domain-containing protein [Hyphomicrobiaceae bacterium]